MRFWRILDNQLYDIGDVTHLGFPESDPSFIPDEYLNSRSFAIMRTCFGLGDWGIISAMPRLLKTKYPDCKVYLPSKQLLNHIFGPMKDNWPSWSDPYDVVYTVFANNPYIDGFLDSIDGDVFHDHYRIHDENNTDIPLVEQMLKFWQFSSDELKDISPELYFSPEERLLGDAIIKDTVGESPYGCFLISDRYRYESDQLLTNELLKYPLPYFYWTKDPIDMTCFKFINKALNLRNIDTRIQLYIKSKANVNIGNQSGISQMVTRYSNVITLQRQFPIASNIVPGETYLIDTDKNYLLSDVPDKWESKTTTSIRFKSELYDFFNKEEYRNKTALEIGSSTGYTTRMLSSLFRHVTAVDILPDRHEYSKHNVNYNNNNISYVIADVYNHPWDFGHHDIVLIDCIHDYMHVRQDIQNAMQYCNRPIIVFDDYGLFPDIKQAIDEFIELGHLEVLSYIGHEKGTIIPKTQNKVLKHYEGIICQVK
jgi:2-polyprenyl-3-methyl-5-hydroxy-6-metoxy-1,4-benzoquinol methylase